MYLASIDISKVNTPRWSWTRWCKPGVSTGDSLQGRSRICQRVSWCWFACKWNAASTVTWSNYTAL